jgi:3-oxoacyl-[acyl-carrier-protein] synthase II
VSRRRVVITGLGVISPVGITVSSAWNSIISGKSGVKLIEDFDTSNFTTKFAGIIKNFIATDYINPKDEKKCDLFIQYGIAAGIQAVCDGGIDKPEGLNLDRIGIIMGAGIGGIGTIEQNYKIITTFGPRRISPFFIPASIINMISGHLSIKYGFRGPNLAIATACATGTHCIGMAARMIAYGDVDIMIAGGSEKASTPLGMGGFSAARALSTRNDTPELASRPWDKSRDGFVLGDGAGAVVLEEYTHAKRRGAKVYAELIGFGMSSDAHHITLPSGDGAVLAMKLAMQDAGINPEEINYINAHGTSTVAGDLEESNAIKKILGNDIAKRVMISSTKSMTGHLLGAAGAVETVFTVLSLKNQIVPPTINLDTPGEGCDLDYVPNTARTSNLNIALSNSFGFGGTNGSLIFKML